MCHGWVFFAVNEPHTNVRTPVFHRFPQDDRTPPTRHRPNRTTLLGFRGSTGRAGNGIEFAMKVVVRRLGLVLWCVALIEIIPECL